MADFNIDKLNNVQKEIVMHTEGPVFVSAGAGSGKTRVLTHRICYLILEKKVNPNNILAITFTNKATNEMKQRIESFCSGASNVWVSTFHSMCAKILRENIAHLDGFDRYFTIYDESDKDKIIKKIIKDYEIDLDFKKIIWHISNAKNMGLNAEEYYDVIKYDNNRNDIRLVYSNYEKTLKESNSLDFDDLLLKTLELFNTNSEVLNYYKNKFKYIHIDEFQDTNLVQYKIVKLLANEFNNVFAVGDEDQCIYCWRGANIENVKNFIEDFSNCKVFKLEQNYRSTKTILKHANMLIKNNSERLQKILFTENCEGDIITYYQAYDENDEAEYVAKTISNLIAHGIKPSEIGVFMRISALSRITEEKMLNYNIPYIVSGIFKFFDRAEIKDLLAYLRIIVNPKDIASLLRIINVPKRNIGQATIDKLIELARVNNTDISSVILNYNTLNLPDNIKTKIMGFAELLNDLYNDYENMSLSEFAERVVKKTDIKSMYSTKSDEDIDKIENINQLLQSINNFEKVNSGGLIEYLESVTLQNDLDNNNNTDCVSISTIHASKGLEFEYVYIIGLEEGCFPLSRALDDNHELEEERRLMYVAITRAKNKLCITRAKSRFLYGKREQTMQSRFVSEMGLSAPDTSKFRSAYDNDGYQSQTEYGSNYVKNYYSPKVAQTENFVSETVLNKTELINKITKNNANSFNVGDNVLHPKFGVGTIVKIEKAGNTQFAMINFNSFGVKTLSLEFAPIKKIQ